MDGRLAGLLLGAAPLHALLAVGLVVVRDESIAAKKEKNHLLLLLLLALLLLGVHACMHRSSHQSHLNLHCMAARTRHPLAST